MVTASMDPELSRLERRILAVLEEAGEDTISALTNTVGVPVGTPFEIAKIQSALIHLVRAGLAELGFSRNPAGGWVSAPLNEGIGFLESLLNRLEWDTASKLWRQAKGDCGGHVLLMHAGFHAAFQVLSEDGWPTKPLNDYQ